MNSVLILLRTRQCAFAKLWDYAQPPSFACMVMVCSNASRRREKSRKELIQEIMTDPRDTKGFAASEDLENLTDLVENNFMGFHGGVKQDEDRAKKMLKKKIIERKYFKKPQEQNLLTWDAKEQIRYLHQENPEEWTVERITESFPTSHEGAIKLLKSSFVPHTIKEIVRHDKRVIKNWKLLKAGVSVDKVRNLEEGPVKSRYEALLQSGVLRLMENADGIKSLPSPQNNKLLMAKDSSPAKPGVFLSIVKDYTEKKREKDMETVKLIESQRKETSSALSNLTAVIESVVPASGKSESTAQIQPKTKQVKEDSLVKRVQKDTSVSLSLLDVMDGNFDSLSQNTNRSLHEEFLQHESIQHSQHDDEIYKENKFTESRFAGDSLPGMKDNKPKRKGLRRRRNISPKSESVAIDKAIDKGMEGTTVRRHRQNMTNVTLTEDDGSDWLKKEISLETTPEGAEHVYMYDPDSGYQFPYGRSDLEEKIDVEPTKKSDRPKLYRKDKDFYDTEGEFLYRIP